MRIARGELIAGVPAVKLRDYFLANFDATCISAKNLANYLSASGGALDAIILALIERDLISPSDDTDADLYPKGPNAGRFACAKAVKPLTRIEADRLVAAFLDRARAINDRARAINESSEYLYWVDEVALFGSCADPDRSDFGDIDMAIELTRKPVPDGERYAELALERFRLSGLANKSYVDELLYPKTEIIRILKARNAYFSIHMIEELRRLECASTSIYRRVTDPDKSE